MAGAAMRDALDQIAAAIPFRALLLVRHQDAGLEEQPVPAAHDDAIVERKAQLGRARRIAHRRQRRQIGADGKNVLPRQPGEMRIGEGRVIARTVARHAEAQRAVELVIAPGAEAGLAVRRQVGRVDAAERGIDPLAAGERFGRIGGVAARAVAGLRQRLAARDVLSGRFGAGSVLSWAWPSPTASAVHKSKPARIVRMSSLHPLASSGVIARKRRRVATSCRFAPGLPDDTNRKAAPLFPARSCDLRKRGSIAEICSAWPGKSDIDWF